MECFYIYILNALVFAQSSLGQGISCTHCYESKNSFQMILNDESCKYIIARLLYK